MKFISCFCVILLASLTTSSVVAKDIDYTCSGYIAYVGEPDYLVQKDIEILSSELTTISKESRALWKSGEFKKAHTAHIRAFKILLELEQRDRDNSKWGKGVPVFYEIAGELNLEMDDLNKASQFFHCALNVYREFSRLEPDQQKWKSRIINVYARLANIIAE